MKKTLFFILSLLSFQLFSQSVDVKWSELQTYENKLDGFFSEYIGVNSKYIYAKFNKAARKPERADNKIKIVAFDKSSMKKVTSKAIIGFKENSGDKAKYDGLTYFDALVFDNSVIMFWSKKVKDKYELYAEQYDEKLTTKIKLKKIYEVPKKGKKYDPNFFVIGNKDVGNKVIIGAELPSDKGENMTFEYKVLKTDFSFESANQVKLPYIATSNKDGLTSSYEIGDDGNLYVKSKVLVEEASGSKKGSTFVSVNSLSVIKPATGTINTYNFRLENKSFSDFDYIVNKQGVKIYALYSDLLKDKRGSDLHGIYYAEIDNNVNAISNSKLISFDKATLDKLFAKDKAEKNKAGVFASKKKKESAEESLQYSYNIENVQIADNNSIVIFCSIMNNYSTTTCDGKGNCTTRYYCYKGNVTTFKVNSNGELVWASNVDRAITYNGWFVYDVEVVKENNKYYAVYGNTSQIVGQKKNGDAKKKRKSKTQKRDMFEYSVFNDVDGSFKRNEYVINSPKANKKERKSVGPNNIVVLDNKMYINSMTVRMKTWPIIAGCTIGLIFPPIIAVPFFVSDFRKGWGYLGTITPLK